MGSRAGIILGIIIVVLAFIMLPLTLDSFQDVAQATTSNSATVTTAASITSGNITLHSSLYNNNVDSVYNITSTDTDDIPLASTYTVDTKLLNVTGLDDDSSRTLTVYYYSPRDDYQISTIIPIAPIVIFISLMCCGLGLAWRSWSR